MRHLSLFSPLRRWLTWDKAIGLLLLLPVVWAMADWQQAEPVGAMEQATYVGRAACIECHQGEHHKFLGSHHDHAMELATDETVRGDFDNATFERLGVTTRFFRRGKEFWVNTEGPDGALHDYQIQYTFGYQPLQQYMVELAGGRVQVLRVSWDTEREEWFYVPAPDAVDERVPPGDPAHWTGISQNWNSMCAECHSTNLQKNFDPATNSYQTTFSEIDVSCEACHGPGSLHVKLARSRSLFWDRRHGYGLVKLKGEDPTPQLETCAPCHSRRTTVCPDFRPGDRYGDHYSLALLDEGLYHADGQILDEVYVYGSFLQSKMHAAGVRCTDCHDPHSLRPKFEGNALCAQCHEPERYDTPTHHHHKMGTPAASCVECHMPETKYMVVDPRRDHSIRIPRPDLTVKIGTPNVCNRCHTKPEEDAQWATDKVVEWYGEYRPDDPHWAPAIAAGRRGDADAEEQLLAVVRRPQVPAIARATAYGLLGRQPTPKARQALVKALTDEAPLIRQAAVRAVPAESAEALVELAAPLLSDPVRQVRVAAAERLLLVDRQAFSPAQQKLLDKGIEEHRQQLEVMAERGVSQLRLSQMATVQGDLPQAIQALRRAMEFEPYLSGPRQELARLLEQTASNQPLDKQEALQQEVQELRQQEVELLRRDAEFLPTNGEIRYQLGLLLYLVGELEQAEQRLTDAHERAPQSREFLLGLALLQQERYRRTGDTEIRDRTVESLRKLHDLDPSNPMAGNLLRELMQLRP